jgi:hypothetical protein
VPLLRDLIDQIDRVLGAVLLHVGGGEPLLHFDLMKQLISYLNGTNIVVEYLESNGSSLLKEAHSKLKGLKDAGLDCMLVSISPFHNEFIAVSALRRIMQEVVSVFGYRGLFPWHPGFLPFLEKVSADKPVKLETYFNAYSPEEIAYQLTSIMYVHPGGKGAYLLAKHLPCHPAERLLNKECSDNLGSPVHAHLDLQGNYLTGFCSGLRVGKQSGRDLDRLYREGIRLSRYPILDMLVNQGVRGVYRAALQAGYEPRKEGYVSSCHLCLDARIHLYFHQQNHEELYPSFFYEELRGMR